MELIRDLIVLSLGPLCKGLSKAKVSIVGAGRQKEPEKNPADLDLIKRSPFVIRDNKSKPIFEHDNTGEIRAGIQQNHKILGHGRNPIINTVGVQDLSANRQEIDIEKIFTPEVDLDKHSPPHGTQ